MIGKGYVAKSLDNTCNCPNLIRYEYAYATKIVTDIISRDTAAISLDIYPYKVVVYL